MGCQGGGGIFGVLQQYMPKDLVIMPTHMYAGAHKCANIFCLTIAFFYFVCYNYLDIVDEISYLESFLTKIY